MVSWSGDGTLSGYDGTTRQWKKAAYLFASPGSVPLAGVTRLGLALNETSFPPGFYPNYLVASAAFTITSGDVSFYALDSNHKIGLVLYVANANNWADGVVPTPLQIRTAALSNGYSRKSTSSYSTAGTRTVEMAGPRPTQNGLYWVLILPERFTTGSVNSVLLGGVDNNVLGRALSVWTNRTPAAPVITSPTTNTLVAPGTSFTLTYATNDPDAVSPDDAQRLNRDLAGVEFQYAAQPTLDNPSPTWMPFPFRPLSGALTNRSWEVKGTYTTAPLNEFAYLRENLGADVVCGYDPDPSSPDTTTVYAKGILPAGDWQIRCRTFDFGHPYPLLARPVSGNPLTGTGGLTPTDYPATNTSLWSAAVQVSIPAQVPAPLALSPRDEVAVPFGGDAVRLTWQYRNTFVPPFNQASVVVQVRKVHDPDWTTVFSGASSDEFFDVTDAEFVFEQSARYEWQVSATDSDDQTSAFSIAARFWIVPNPGTGAERPLSTELIDGATLGCGRHTIEVYRRGGLIRTGVIDKVSYVDYGRVRDDISTAKIVVSGWDIDSGNLLASLQCWAYEVVIWRDNGFSNDRVWEGPITLLKYEKDAVTIQAKDMMGYAYRRIIKQKMSDAGVDPLPTVVDRARRVLQNVFAPDDPNVLAYLQVISNDDDAKQFRSTPAYSRTAFEEVDDMAANSGLDYTVVGRSILLWGTKHRIGTLPEFKDNDLGAVPIVSEYGMSMANRYAVSDGNGVYGEATRLDEDGMDETYGLVEMLSSTWASDTPAQTGTYTQAGLQTMIQSFEEFSERSIADRYPPPVVVRLPDNTTLNPSAVISIQHLVPGVVVPLRSSGTLRTVVGNQKLDSVKVVETKGKETISISLSAFNRDDLGVETEDA